MLYKLKPKHLMIFGVLCMVIGLGFLALWKHVSPPGMIKHSGIVHWATHTLGRYGISSIYFFGGLVAFLRGYAAMRSEERSRQIQQQVQQQQYQQQQGNWPGMNQ